MTSKIKIVCVKMDIACISKIIFSYFIELNKLNIEIM